MCVCISTESGFYVMPAASQNRRTHTGKQRKTNIKGCPFCMFDDFPSHKYQRSLQNQFTLNRPVILPYKDLNTFALWNIGCVYVYTCQAMYGCSTEAPIH